MQITSSAVVTPRPALAPMATFELPVVLLVSAKKPSAVLLSPVVLLPSTPTHAKGFGENPAQMLFILKDITGCTSGTERINSLELFFKDSDHLIEKWETLKPDGM